MIDLYIRSVQDSRLTSWFDEIWIDLLDLGDVVEPLREPVTEAWGTSAETLIARFGERLGTSPFADAGERRAIRFAALGISWEVVFANDYETTVVAERFVAMIQIVLSDFAGEELALLPTEVNVAIQLGRTLETQPLSSNIDSRWAITLPPVDDRGAADVQLETITPIAAIPQRTLTTSSRRAEQRDRVRL